MLQKMLIVLGAMIATASCSQSSDDLGSRGTGVIVYAGATIYTMNPLQETAESLVVSGEGRIAFLGSTSDAMAFAGGDAEVRDLTGKTIIPGFFDGHAHPGLIGVFGSEDIIDQDAVLPKLSKEDTLEWLRQYSNSPNLPPFIVLGEWDVEAFLPAGPTREELDAIFPHRPVLLADNSGHSFWLNSVALKLAGVDENTADVSPGISYLVRDDAGALTGWVKEFALMEQMTPLLSIPHEDLKTGIKEYVDWLSARGVTTLLDAGNFLWTDDVYNAMAELDREGELPMRIEGAYHVWAPQQLDAAISEMHRLQSAYGGERLNINTMKVHFDGVTEIGTAGMLEPYDIGTSSRGGVLFSAEELQSLIIDLEREQIHLHVHAVGDWAVREALDAVEGAIDELAKPLSIEVTLSHLEIVAPRDISRFSELDVHANFTPHWFAGNHFGGAARVWLGAARSKRQQVAQHFVDAGVNVTFSSDTTTAIERHRSNPFVGIQMGVTRAEYGDPEATTYGPESARMTLQDTMRAYTINGARQFGMAASHGSLVTGKSADFIVLPADIFQMNINDVHSLLPETVYVDGVLETENISPQHEDGTIEGDKT